MKRIEEIQEAIDRYQGILARIDEIRNQEAEKEATAKRQLGFLIDELPQLLAERALGETPDSDVIDVKTEIVRQKETIEEAPLTLEGLDLRKSSIIQDLQSAQDLLEQYEHEAELEKLREYIPKNFFGREFELIAKPQNVNYGPGEFTISIEIDEGGNVTGSAIAQHVNVPPGSYEKITGTISPTGRVEINMKAEWYYGKSVGDYKVSGNILRDGSVKLFAQASREIHPPGNFKIIGNVEGGVELFCEAQRSSYKGPGNYRVKSIQ